MPTYTRHVFLIDVNDTGEMWRLTIEGHKPSIEEFLYTLSNDVRYIKATKAHKKDCGIRRLPCGVVRRATFDYDKLNNAYQRKTKYIDSRKQVMS